MTKKVLAFLSLALLVAGNALAADINFTTPIGQGDFKSLSKEAGAALAYKNVAPPHPLGITGFDIGVEAEAVEINKDNGYWKAAFNNDAPSYLVLPKLRVRKGLPYGIDIGGMYSNVSSANIQLYGLEVSKSILEGGVAMPALSVRGTYTRLAGIKDLDVQTYGVDASIGKGFLFVTPYAGAGYIWIDSKASGDLQRLAIAAGMPLKAEKISQGRVFAGVEVKPLPLVRITGEFEYAVRPIYSLKASIGF